MELEFWKFWTRWEPNGPLAGIWPNDNHPVTDEPLVYCDPKAFEIITHSYNKGDLTMPPSPKITARFTTGKGAWVEGIKVGSGKWYWTKWEIRCKGGFGLFGFCNDEKG